MTLEVRQTERCKAECIHEHLSRTVPHAEEPHIDGTSEHSLGSSTAERLTKLHGIREVTGWYPIDGNRGTDVQRGHQDV